MPKQGNITVDRERVQKLIVALSCASFDRFDIPEAQIVAKEDDDFGMLEGVLQLFIDELAVAKAMLEQNLFETEQARAELERRLETIERQRLTISELSTPVIDLWDGVLTLPIVGAIDSQRAAEITERLLSRIVETKANAVIIDLTGVDVIDTGIAEHLGRLARATGLLGAKVVLTGIGPHVAKTLATLDVDLGGVRTLQTLRDGLRLCISEVEARRRVGARA